MRQDTIRQLYAAFRNEVGILLDKCESVALECVDEEPDSCFCATYAHIQETHEGDPILLVLDDLIDRKDLPTQLAIAVACLVSASLAIYEDRVRGHYETKGAIVHDLLEELLAVAEDHDE